MRKVIQSGKLKSSLTKLILFEAGCFLQIRTSVDIELHTETNYSFKVWNEEISITTDMVVL